MITISCMVPEMWSMTDRIFSHVGPLFYPFSPLTTQKFKILKKEEKTPGYISSFDTSVS